MTAVEMDNVRDGERLVPWVERQDASLVYIGRIHTPWTDLSDCPRQGRLDGPLCKIEVFEPWTLALEGITVGQQTEVLYWLHLSRRDLVQQCPRNDGQARGTFSIRSPIRPNPIGTTIVKVESIEGNILTVRGMDCLDGTPLIDLKPDLAQFVPLAKEKPGDRQVG